MYSLNILLFYLSIIYQLKKVSKKAGYKHIDSIITAMKNFKEKTRRKYNNNGYARKLG